MNSRSGFTRAKNIRVKLQMTQIQSSNDILKPFLIGQVVIRSDEPIELVANRLSSTWLNGVPFGGKDEGIYEEVPAMYAEVVGLRFVLSGFAGKHYLLECFPSPRLPTTEESVSNVDISYHLLRS